MRACAQQPRTRVNLEIIKKKSRNIQSLLACAQPNALLQSTIDNAIDMELMPNEPTLISEIHLSSMYTHYCTDADALWPNSPPLHGKRAITAAQPTPTHPHTPARHRRAQERLHSRHTQGGLALRSSPRIVSFAHFG